MAVNYKRVKIDSTMNSPKLIVTEQKPNSWYISIVFASFILLVGVYLLGRFLAVKDLSQTKQLLSDAQLSLNNTEIAYSEISESLILEKQSTLVETLSNQELIESIQTLKLEQKSMEEELSFYRNIMAPEKDAKGLNIDHLAVTKIDSDGKFHFSLTIIQAQKQTRFLKGKVEITVFGQDKNNQANQLSYQFRELGTFKSADFKFQFKYFQNLQGFIQLPENFMPQRLVATAKTQGLRKNQTAKLEMVWLPEEK